MGWGKTRGERVYMLACADDLVLIAEDEEGMRSMIERLEGYMERKRLEVNTEKMKIMRLGREGDRSDGEEDMEMERKRVGGGERIQVPRICNTKEWGARDTGEG